ncbi:MAG: hypothetical protein ACRC47_02890 [Shewanella sp.]
MTRLVDLNNILFDQLRRLNDTSVTGVALTDEIERSKAVTMVGREIINNGRLALDVEKTRGDVIGVSRMPPMLEHR